MLVPRTILSLWLLLLFLPDMKGDCPRPTTSENAVMTTSDSIFEEGTTIRLTCHSGYEPSPGSPRSFTCSGGLWSSRPEDFTCQKKSCGNAGDFRNGHYDYAEGVEFAATITAICRPGYFLIGNSKRACMANGEWDGSEPFCQVRTCRQPPDVPNGKPTLPLEEEYEHDRVVQYVCDPGYTFVNQTFVTCDGGSWSEAPQCLRVSCEKPNVTNATRVEGGSGPYKHKYTLRYECHKGYKLKSGTGRTVCTKDGWSPPVECEVVECPNPDTTNATITKRTGPPYVYGAVVEYGCQTGQRLVGNPRVICESDGQWSPHPPSCKVVECPNPDTTNANITKRTGPPYVYGAVVEYGCQTGQRLVGNPRVICGSDGQWSSNLPVCQVVECPVPVKTNATIINGQDGPYRPGHVIQYQCLHHHMHGKSHLTCGPDGQWSAKPPVCKEKPVPPVPWRKIIIGILVGAGIVVVVVVIVGYRYKRSKSEKISTNNDGCEPTPSPENDTVLTPLKTDISPPPSKDPVPV